MADVQTTLENLREIIAKLVADLETWNTLHEVKQALGLPHEEPERIGKQQYLRRITAMASDQVVIHAAQRMLNSYPGTREKPLEADLQTIQDALWWIESRGIQQISNVIRYRIAESLEGIRFSGRFSLNEFLSPIFPAKNCYFYPATVKVGNDGYLYEGSFQPSRISVVKYLQQLGLTEWPDQRFCQLIESIVHPEVQLPKMQHTLYKQLNELLQQDNFELREEGSQGGLPVYKVRGKIAGVSGAPKYIIFASIGLKPDIVIDDVVNMNIRVVRYAEQCLVYDQPPPSGDLTWTMLVEWWRRVSGTTSNDTDTRRNLGERLIASLQSEPERFLFVTYFKAFKSILGDNLPALLPQVYLHYDPRHRKERSEPVLVRQRMDFLMLLRNATRIVIEIDGVQHYSNDDGHASPQRYAEMVAEDRRIKGLGYEVYRFGGAEIVAWDGEKFVIQSSAYETIVRFFEELFSRHGIS
jgi:hypothetical protein